MKKYLILLVIFFSSCGYASLDTRKSCIVTEIIQIDTSFCYYYGGGNWGGYVTMSSTNFQIIDSIGKYNVGDPIKLGK